MLLRTFLLKTVNSEKTLYRASAILLIKYIVLILLKVFISPTNRIRGFLLQNCFTQGIFKENEPSSPLRVKNVYQLNFLKNSLKTYLSISILFTEFPGVISRHNFACVLNYEQTSAHSGFSKYTSLFFFYRSDSNIQLGDENAESLFNKEPYLSRP